jgi:hypothetical protein
MKMPLEAIALFDSGVIVGGLAAMLVVSLCVAANYAVKLIDPFLSGP